MENLTFKEATLQDYDAVMAINDNIYGGLDYLPDYYKLFMTMPSMTAFLAEKKGETVAFCIAQILDNETTLVLRAARVKEVYQGKGILKELTAHLKRKMKQMYPTIQRRCIVTLQTVGDEKPFPTGYVQICKKRMLSFYQQASIIEKKLMEMGESAGGIDVHQLGSEELQQLLGSKWALNLFPKEKVIINWVPYSIIPSNGPIIATESDAFLTHEENKDKAEQSPDVFSAVNFIFCKKIGLRLSLDLYGIRQSNMAVVKEHIVHHARNAVFKAKEAGCEGIHVELYVEVDAPLEELLGITSSLELKSSDFFVMNKEKYVYLLEAVL
ncbi:histidine N-acetyltransferase-like [Lingula anatina]|uniref:Histidine N-acetyltransferase-like n=1 Tax=Lingula anatina TaxID=7574 RepID=A0A1S3H663_LINAN|nr:histidine N-acetyltransferase-like [Lingula anatina]|eukprot:XP_013380614.1 histidine N-acetyltransferase-like [Lingula anatina]